MKKYPLLLISLAILGSLASCGRPTARFSWYAKDLIAPTTIRFNNDSKRAESYFWDFGDGTSSADKTPDHKYSVSGNYTITLTAKKGAAEKSTSETIFIDAPEKCLIEVETSLGRIVLLLSDATPRHRDNFIKLAEEDFFDGLLFHRVIQGFMIQGGDPESRNALPGQGLGSGGPGYLIPAEFVDSLIHIKGAVAAARTGDALNPEKKSSGSQFYIVQGGPVTNEKLDLLEAKKNFRYSTKQREAYLKYGGAPDLDRDYTVFGIVVEGLDVIDKIAASKTDNRNRPMKNIEMKMKVIK